MYDLGHTCSTSRRGYLLHTPDANVRTPLPSLTRGMAIVHIAPAGGAAFSHASVELESGGTLTQSALPDIQRFVYIVSGAADLRVGGTTHALAPGGFAYLPSDTPHTLTASEETVLQLIEKLHVPLDGAPAPKFHIGNEDDLEATPLAEDSDVTVCTLVPAASGYDFAVNTMTYPPGASLPQVEVHFMEHGMIMLEGGGVYRLAGDWFPVTAGDFIWMAPFCPQWFGCLGKVPAKYLIYKDFNRHPLA